MRYTGPLLLLLTFTTTAPSAQSSWAEKLLPDGIRHDFGSVPYGGQVYHRFRLLNIYAVPLEIHYRIGCTCVTITPSTRVLQPRQEGYLDVFMDARRFKGHKAVNIYFSVGPEYISSTTIQVTAHSRVDVVLNPGQVSFGVGAAGQPRQPQTVDVEYAGALDWRITGVADHAAPLDVQFHELYRRPGQVGYRVTVALKPDAPAGQIKHEFYLRTNDPAGPLVPVLVEGTVQATLTVVPNVVTFGATKVGETSGRKIILRAGKPFRVVSIEGADESLTVELPTDDASTHIIPLTWKPTKPGDAKHILRFKTNLDGGASVTVTVGGNAGT